MRREKLPLGLRVLPPVAAPAGGDDVGGAIPAASTEWDPMIALRGRHRQRRAAVPTAPAIECEASDHGIHSEASPANVARSFERTTNPIAQASTAAVAPLVLPALELLRMAVAVARVLRGYAIRIALLPVENHRAMSRLVVGAPRREVRQLLLAMALVVPALLGATRVDVLGAPRAVVLTMAGLAVRRAPVLRAGALRELGGGLVSPAFHAGFHVAMITKTGKTRQ